MISSLFRFGLDLVDNQEELDKDAEGMELGFMRMIPFYGSIVSGILAAGLDRNDGTMFRVLDLEIGVHHSFSSKSAPSWEVLSART